MHDAMHRCSVAMHDATSLCEPIVKQHPTGGHVKLHLFGNVAEAFPFGATEARLHKQLKAWGDVEKDDFHDEWLAVLRTTLRRYAPSTSAVGSESTTDDACKAHTAAAPSLCAVAAVLSRRLAARVCHPMHCIFLLTHFHIFKIVLSLKFHKLSCHNVLLEPSGPRF